MRKDFNYMCYDIMDGRYQVKIHVYVSFTEKFSM